MNKGNDNIIKENKLIKAITELSYWYFQLEVLGLIAYNSIIELFNNMKEYRRELKEHEVRIH